MQALSGDAQQSARQELQDMLQTLPDKVSYPIMVPFGSVAFFPGRLIHTNECMVDLGGETMVEMSAKETVDLLRARQSSAGPSLPDAAAQQKGYQQAATHTPHSTLPQQAGQLFKQPGQQSAQQTVQKSTPSLDDQILEIMEEYDEAVHGPLQKASPEDFTLSQHPGKVPKPSFPISSSVMKSSPASTLTLPASTSPHVQQHQQRSSASPSMQANTHDKTVAADKSNTMTATRKQHSELPDQQQRVQQQQQQLVQQPQHLHPQQDTLKQDPQLQQGQACTQDDGDFEVMMARFDELAQQEAATPSEHPAEAAAVTTRDFNASNATIAPRTAAAAAPATTVPVGSATGRDAVMPAPMIASPAVSKAKAKSSSDRGTGLKRGFFAQPKTKSAGTTASIGPAAGTGRMSQPPEAESSQATAFTGNVLEHNASTHAEASLPHNLASANRGSHGGVATAESAQPPKRMSKFKQSRHMQQHV